MKHEKFTHLTSSLHICVNSWVSWNFAAIEWCVWELVINWVIVTCNSRNFREILSFFLLLRCWSVFVILLKKNSMLCNCRTSRICSLTSVRILTASDKATNAQKVKIFDNIFLFLFLANLSLLLKTISLQLTPVSNKGRFILKGKKWEIKTRAFSRLFPKLLQRLKASFA